MWDKVAGRIHQIREDMDVIITGIKILSDFWLLETPEPEPKKKPPKMVKIDYGKFMALKKAGWTVEQIAEEFKCSTGTIYAYQKAIKEDEG